MTIIRLLAAVYFYAGMPLLLGMTRNKLKKESKPSGAVTYMDGYLIWFALFFVGTFFEYRKYEQFSYWKMTRVWTLGLAVLTVVCLIILNKTLWECAKNRLKNLFQNKYVLLALGLSAFSILFVTPLATDDLIERGNQMIQCDVIRTAEMHKLSYPELFYTIPAGMFRISLASCVHVAAAFGLLLFFFATYRSIALTLYKEEKYRGVFFGIVILFYLCMVIANVHLSVAVFQNIWNPQTLAISCLLPAMLLKTVELGVCKRKGLLANKKKVAEVFLMILCTMAATQLFLGFGVGLCALLFVFGIVFA